MPRFFIDRSLGAVMLPRALRDAGWEVTTLREHYDEQPGQLVKDVEWLQLVGERGWIVLTKDQKIRYNATERAALIRFGVKAFYLSTGKLTSADQISIFLSHQQKIMHLCDEPGPFVYSVSRRQLLRVPLL